MLGIFFPSVQQYVRCTIFFSLRLLEIHVLKRFTHYKDVLTVLDSPLNDKAKKATKRKRTIEDCGEMAKRRSARVRNTKSKKEEKIDFQELLLKILPSRY